MLSRPDRILWLLLAAWLLLCLLITLAAIAYTSHPHAWASWQAAARQAEQLHQLQLAQAQDQQSEQRYLAWVQGECGPETWWKPTPSGALACTDKRGRRTGINLVEAQR